MSDEIPEAREAARKHHGGYFDAMNSATRENLIYHIDGACRAYAARENAKLRTQLSNILARAHCDGGHYEAEHETEKACEDADAVIAQAYADVDELREKLADAEGESRESHSKTDNMFLSMSKQIDTAIARAEAAEKQSEYFKAIWLSDEAENDKLLTDAGIPDWDETLGEYGALTEAQRIEMLVTQRDALKRTVVSLAGAG